jgi:hypothetical protein
MAIIFTFQGHKQNSTEIGYLLTKKQVWSVVRGGFVNGVDMAWGYKSRREGSSLYRLIDEIDMGLKTLLVGPRSLGALLEAEGYPAIPSPTIPTSGSKSLLLCSFF